MATSLLTVSGLYPWEDAGLELASRDQLHLPTTLKIMEAEEMAQQLVKSTTEVWRSTLAPN